VDLRLVESCWEKTCFECSAEIEFAVGESDDAAAVVVEGVVEPKAEVARRKKGIECEVSLVELLLEWRLANRFVLKLQQKVLKSDGVVVLLGVVDVVVVRDSLLHTSNTPTHCASTSPSCDPRVQKPEQCLLDPFEREKSYYDATHDKHSYGY